MKTIIFGGSFDPIHNGHLKIAELAMKNINADRVLFIPAKQARWKENPTDGIDRLNMIKLAIRDYPYMEVSEIELDAKEDVNYSYNTILKLKEKSNDDFYLLIGADHVERLNEWYMIDELSKLVQFIAFARPDYKMDSNNIQKYNVQVIGSVVSKMSSSSLRKCQMLDAPKAVLHYLEERELYYIKGIKKHISEKRYLHSLNVASLAYEIAQNNGVEPHKAYLASLLHDIGKEVPMSLHFEIIKKLHLEPYLNMNKSLYHQFTSYYIAKNEYGINDFEILDAIMYHASGKNNMSKLGRIIYASDKIEPTRGFDSRELIEDCKKDIDIGFINVLKENIKFFNKNNINYNNELTNSCIDYYLKGE